MQSLETASDLLRVAIFNQLVSKFGSVAPLTAAAAFEVCRGYSITPAALSQRRAAARLPWPESVEITDGPRRLVPLVSIVDVLAGFTPADAARPHRGRGRPRKAAGQHGGEVME